MLNLITKNCKAKILAKLQRLLKEGKQYKNTITPLPEEHKNGSI